MIWVLDFTVVGQERLKAIKIYSKQELYRKLLREGRSAIIVVGWPTTLLPYLLGNTFDIPIDPSNPTVKRLKAVIK